MGELFLVLLAVCVICGGGPILLFSYLQGSLKMPKRIVYILIFSGVAVLAIMRYPLNFLQSPVKDIAALVVYVFIGRILRKEYSQKGGRFCFIYILAANIVGIFTKFVVAMCWTVLWKNDFTIRGIAIFLLAVQCVVMLSYFLAPEKANRTDGRPKK